MNDDSGGEIVVVEGDSGGGRCRGRTVSGEGGVGRW